MKGGDNRYMKTKKLYNPYTMMKHRRNVFTQRNAMVSPTQVCSHKLLFSKSPEGSTQRGMIRQVARCNSKVGGITLMKDRKKSPLLVIKSATAFSP